MIDTSRLPSVQTVHGFCVSILPQILQTSIFSIAVSSAEASGAISNSRFLMRCSAARRAERGPSPGSRASSWIRRSISGPATAISSTTSFQERLTEPEARRQAELAGDGLHLLLHRDLGLAARIVVRGNQEILEDLDVLGLDQGWIDLDALHVHLRGHAHRDQPAARGTLDLDIAEFR